MKTGTDWPVMSGNRKGSSQYPRGALSRRTYVSPWLFAIVYAGGFFVIQRAFTHCEPLPFGFVPPAIRGRILRP
jgi:hypothetical protein